ncbi:hypothetical protein LCGC14_0579870 [marine sediment metagenome]|uniref:Uncharacterized protein n=1 Tax=marine sediment metagenome TaxID=412755 RepID=A0A0F9RGQ5_9ZZZZ
MEDRRKYQITIAAVKERTFTVTVYNTSEEISCQSEARAVEKAQEQWRNSNCFPIITRNGINEVC